MAAVAACVAMRDLAGEAGARLGVGLKGWGDRALGDRGSRALAAAGQPGGIGSRQWLVLKSTFAALTAALALISALPSPSRVALLLVLAAPVAGFVAPDVYLARRASRRMEEAVRALPDMLDLLRVAVEAGMPPLRALGTVAAQFSGPLAVEWRRAAAEVVLGAPQDEALAALGDRLPAEEVRALVAALGRSHRHGVPLRSVLAAQAARARHRRRQRVREQAAHAGPKIQLVVALLLVPSVLLMVAAAIVAELERSGLYLPA